MTGRPNKTKILFPGQYETNILFLNLLGTVPGRIRREEIMKFGIIGAGRIGKIHGGNVAARRDR